MMRIDHVTKRWLRDVALVAWQLGAAGGARCGAARQQVDRAHRQGQAAGATVRSFDAARRPVKRSLLPGNNHVMNRCWRLHA